MTIHQISELSLKLVGILCIAYATSHLGYFSSFLFLEDPPSTSLIVTGGVGPIVGPVLIAGLLFWKARHWGKRLVESEPPDQAAGSATLLEWHSLLLSLLGLYLIVTALFPLINQLFAIYQASQQPGYEGLSFGHMGWLIGYGTTILVGLGLMLGAQGVARALRKLRYAGT